MGSVTMGLSMGKVKKKELNDRHNYQSRRLPRIPGVPPDAVSIQFAAQVIGVHSHTVRRWIKWRYLPAYRVGANVIRIRRDHVLQIVESLKLAMAEPGWGEFYAEFPAMVVKTIQFSS